MKEAMVEALAGDGDVHIVSDGEIQEALPADHVMLWEEDLLFAPIQYPPTGNPALEGSPDAIGNGGLPELVLHTLESGDGENAADLQLLFHAWPYLFQEGGHGTPVPRRFFWDSRRGFLSIRRALRSLIPALAAATAWVW